MSRRSSEFRARPVGQPGPGSRSPRRKFPLIDPVTYWYAVAALLGTAVLQDLLAPVLSHLQQR